MSKGRYPPRGLASVSYNAFRGVARFPIETVLVGNRMGTVKKADAITLGKKALVR